MDSEIPSGRTITTRHYGTGSFYLPVELWALVLGHLVNSNDISELWSVCRRVSRTWKAAAELAFCATALPELQINLSLIGCIGRNYGDMSQLQYKRLSNDRQRVYYGVSDSIGASTRQDEYLPGAMPGLIHDDRVQGNLPLLIEWTSKVYISVCRGPTSYYNWSAQYGNQLRHVWLEANTEKAMEMIVHHAKHEVSFLWLPMLEVFLRHIH